MTEKTQSPQKTDERGLPPGRGPGGVEHLAAALRTMGRVWRDAAQAALQGQGLTLLQWAVLELVWERPGMSQIELARAMGIEGPSLVRLLDVMERLGWLVRKSDPADRRVNRVFPNETAHSKMQEAEKAIASVQRQAVALMSEADQKDFARLLERAVEGLRNPGPGGA